MKPPMVILSSMTSTPPTSTSITFSAFAMWVRMGMKKARTLDMRMLLSRTAPLRSENLRSAQGNPR